MINLIVINLRGIFRDRIFQGIMFVAVLFLFIPSVSLLSMRQVTELSVTLSLSLVSFILMLLAVFLGATSLWRDIDRRYTHSLLGLPISRTSYLLGRFASNVLFILLASFILSILAYIVIAYSSMIYPSSRPFRWSYLAVAIGYDTLKYVLLVAVGFLFSTISTSFFLPIFGTITIYMVGSSSQDVYNYLHTPSALKTLPHGVIGAAKGLYYILPNLNSFDYTLNAVYGLDLLPRGLLFTLCYFIIYTSILLTISSCIFNRREMN